MQLNSTYISTKNLLNLITFFGLLWSIAIIEIGDISIGIFKEIIILNTNIPLAFLIISIFLHIRFNFEYFLMDFAIRSNEKMQFDYFFTIGTHKLSLLLVGISLFGKSIGNIFYGFLIIFIMVAIYMLLSTILMFIVAPIVFKLGLIKSAARSAILSFFFSLLLSNLIIFFIIIGIGLINQYIYLWFDPYKIWILISTISFLHIGFLLEGRFLPYLFNSNDNIPKKSENE